MLEVPVTATDEEIIAAVASWVDLLAQGRDDEAFALLHWPEPSNWSPQLIRTLATHYGSVEPRKDGQIFRVTRPSEAQVGFTGKKAGHGVSRGRYPETPDGYVGHIWYDLPLNGEWSQVSATFDLQRHDNMLRFVLEDVHVL